MATLISSIRPGWAAAEESAGMETDSWIHPEDVESFLQTWRESIAKGESSMERLIAARFPIHHDLCCKGAKPFEISILVLAAA